MSQPIALPCGAQVQPRSHSFGIRQQPRLNFSLHCLMALVMVISPTLKVWLVGPTEKEPVTTLIMMRLKAGIDETETALARY